MFRNCCTLLHQSQCRWSDCDSRSQQNPLPALIGALQTAADYVSETLTKSLYKFKISFRQPNPTHVDFNTKHPDFLDQTHCLLLEDKTKP